LAEPQRAVRRTQNGQTGLLDLDAKTTPVKSILVELH